MEKNETRELTIFYRPTPKGQELLYQIDNVIDLLGLEEPKRFSPLIG